MNPTKRLLPIPAILVIALLLPGMGLVPSQAQTLTPAEMVDSGSWYSRQEWPHDSRPFESRNFMIFSDAASLEVRRSVAAMAEDVLAELVAEFGIDAPEMFRYPPDQDGKIDIYVYQNYSPQAWGARGYYAGLIIWSLDHGTRNTDLDHYRRVLKHELVHVVGLLLKGRDVLGMNVDTMEHVWFTEGFAEAVTGGTLRAVKDLDYLNYLTGKYGKLSPVSFVHDGQVGDWSKWETAEACSEYHYPMYRLAVEYLMDEDGFGKSTQDLVMVYADMADGTDFETAFENRLGISRQAYEESFFDRMNEYLPEGDFAPVKQMSLVWLGLVAGSLLLLARWIARGPETRRRFGWVWALVTVICGPFGLLGYHLACLRPEQPVNTRRRALGASLYSVAGNGVGLILLFGIFSYLAPAKNPTDFVLLAPFLCGWLLFRAPLVAARSRRRYLLAVVRSLPVEILSTILVLAGMLTLLMQLSERYWFCSLDSGSFVFWPVLAAGALAGTVIVYPLNLWLARRDSAPRPGWLVA